MSPSPKRQPMVRCPSCGAMNDPARGSNRCVSCNLPLATLVQPFQFPATGQHVRTVLIDGEPWFVAVDAATILGYANTRKAVADHVPARHRKGNESFPLADLGLHPQTVLISEPGLYRLIMRSNTALAESFQDWVTDEVLPAIWRTGSYVAADAYEIPRSLPEALRAYAAEVEAHDVTKAALTEAAPAADAWQTLASANPDYSVREAAYILNRDPGIDTGQNRLFNELRRLRVVDSRDIPYSDHARHVKLRPRSFTNRATNEEMPAKPQVRVTADGLAYLHKKLGGTAPIKLDEIGSA